MSTSSQVVAWFEIPSVDFDRAVRFYEAALDVKLNREEIGGHPMAVFSHETPATGGAIIHSPSMTPSYDGVLVYLPEDQVMATLARIAARFPGSLIALDTYPKRTFDQQHRLAARKGIDARWAWACDDPRALERTGLEVRESVTITRPPRAMRAELPFRYRYLIPLADPFLGKALAVTLFRASSPAAAGQDATARAAGAG